MKRFIIRLDAGESVGFGHAVRSVLLARYLRKKYGIETLFYSHYYDKLEEIYKEEGLSCILLKDDSELEILDRIKTDNPGAVLLIDRLFPYTRETIKNLRENLTIIMFHNECDGMFESNFTVFPCAHLSDELVNDRRWMSARASLLHGPEYIIINDEIKAICADLKKKSREVYIAITTGASDKDGIMMQALEWLNDSSLDYTIKALYGFDFYHMDALQSMIPRLKPTIEVKRFNFPDLLSSYLAVSAVGVTVYELIFSTIPVLTIGHTLKNSKAGEILQNRYGCSHHLGLFPNLKKNDFIDSIRRHMDSHDTMNEIRKQQVGFIDGKGIDRLSGMIADLCFKGRIN